MIPNAYRMFNFDLGETADALRETVHDFSNNEIAPRAAEIDRTNQFPVDLWPKLGGARPARDYGRGGIWRLGPRLSRTLRGDGRDFAGVGFGRSFLWGAFKSLHQSAPAQRQHGTEAEIPAEADFRRPCRRARDVGAGFRFRRGVDDDARREEGRSLCAQRLQDVDHQRSGRRDAGGLCQDRSGRRARAASPPSSSKRA